MKGRAPGEFVVAAATELILETFRLNGRLLEAGDQLVSGLGLTSARWQVLGAIDASPSPLSVAQIARNMGLSRQAVQRLANEMTQDGLLVFRDNPHHSRAKLAVMSEKGRKTFTAAMKLQRRWVAELARDAEPEEITVAAALLRKLRIRLET